ncbi:Tim17-domain-containing protein [Cylindrobasidium torrendii FP15055 ss-10]|uniref:Mitochondrial import inner membrane translocase subunit TIM22 n=1 Tax=Cylindrobasidium torrendii FP15055 ss-10 TaxID=1314674 RepID=A0A0D7BP70_9AGAR|nr:Tim17-domain-containing protein [Cylindrobasidium torrendii FP15055 ss-10]
MADSSDPRRALVAPLFPLGREPMPPGVTEEEREAYATAMKYQAKMSGVYESCAVKAAMAGVGGFAIGGLFSLMTTSFQYEDPVLREQMAGGRAQKVSVVAKDMARGVYSQGKMFAKMGALYSAIECCIEGYRAKNDIYNSAASGFIAGGILSHSAGPKGAFYGGLAFAGFSSAIDLYLRKEPDDDD